MHTDCKLSRTLPYNILMDRNISKTIIVMVAVPENIIICIAPKWIQLTPSGISLYCPSDHYMRNKDRSYGVKTCPA